MGLFPEGMTGGAMLLSALFLSADVSAGGLMESIERSVAKRAGQALEKKAARDALTPAEKSALLQQHIRLDEEMRNAILKRYGEYIPREGKIRAMQSRVVFYDKPPQDGLYGWTGTRPHVYARSSRVVTTVLHERIHHLAHSAFKARVSMDLNESMTIFLTRQIGRDVPLKGYELPGADKAKIADMLAARVGERALAKAYFRGDFRELEQALESQLGRGAFERLNRLMATGEGGLRKAAELLKGR